MANKHKYKEKYKDIVKKISYDTFEEHIKNTVPENDYENDYESENIKVAFMVDDLFSLEYRIKEICYANYSFKLKKYTHLIILGEKHQL